MTPRQKALAKNGGKKLVQVMIVLFGITFLTFGLLRLSPKNPAEIWLLGSSGHVGSVSEEALAAQEHAMGLDQPFLVQYIRWVQGAIHGDLGLSYATKTSVSAELMRHVGPTAAMAFFSLLVSVALAVPLGICCAIRPLGVLDRVMQVGSFFALSLPSFVVGLGVLWLFCIRLSWFPILAEDGLRGLLLPCSVLCVQAVFKMNRQVRSILLQELEKPYVDGARIRGVGEREIFFRHVLKNAAAPILTCISLYLGVFLGGSTVIEGIFSVNGLGSLAVSAARTMDYPMIQGFVLWCALVYLAVNRAADGLAALIDPRLKYRLS